MTPTDLNDYDSNVDDQKDEDYDPYDDDNDDELSYLRAKRSRNIIKSARYRAEHHEQVLAQEKIVQRTRNRDFLAMECQALPGKPIEPRLRRAKRRYREKNRAQPWRRDDRAYRERNQARLKELRRLRREESRPVEGETASATGKGMREQLDRRPQEALTGKTIWNGARCLSNVSGDPSRAVEGEREAVSSPPGREKENSREIEDLRTFETNHPPDGLSDASMLCET